MSCDSMLSSRLTLVSQIAHYKLYLMTIAMLRPVSCAECNADS